MTHTEPRRQDVSMIEMVLDPSFATYACLPSCETTTAAGLARTGIVPVTVPVFVSITVTRFAPECVTYAFVCASERVAAARMRIGTNASAQTLNFQGPPIRTVMGYPPLLCRQARRTANYRPTSYTYAFACQTSARQIISGLSRVVRVWRGSSDRVANGL